MSKKIANQAGYSLMITPSGVRRWQKTGGNEPGRAGDAGSVSGDFASNDTKEWDADEISVSLGFESLEYYFDDTYYSDTGYGAYTYDSFSDVLESNRDEIDENGGKFDGKDILMHIPLGGMDALARDINAEIVKGEYRDIGVSVSKGDCIVSLDKAINNMDRVESLCKMAKASKEEYACLDDEEYMERRDEMGFEGDEFIDYYYY